MSLTSASPIDAANAQALQRIYAARPYLVAIRPARELLPQLREYTLLHAGPPVTWEAMCGPMRGALLGAVVYEGWAADLDAAQALVVVENRAHGNLAYCTLNEGLGKVLRYGANDASVVERLRWLQQVVAPALHTALQRAGGIDLRVIMAQALLMGDEMHQRNVGASALLVQSLLPHLARTVPAPEPLGTITEY